jgi:hypothetical protein
MTENEQIEQMANDLAQHCPDLVENCCGASSCVSCLTRFLFNANYRKASEVAKEIFGELEASLGILSFPVVTAVGTVVTERAKGLHISSEDYETIKKRYTEEQNAERKITCKECKHLMFSDCYGECNRSLRMVNPDDTCEYAERKEQNDDGE